MDASLNINENGESYIDAEASEEDEDMVSLVSDSDAEGKTTDEDLPTVNSPINRSSVNTNGAINSYGGSYNLLNKFGVRGSSTLKYLQPNVCVTASNIKILGNISKFYY